MENRTFGIRAASGGLYTRQLLADLIDCGSLPQKDGVTRQIDDRGNLAMTQLNITFVRRNSLDWALDIALAVKITLLVSIMICWFR